MLEIKEGPTMFDFLQLKFSPRISSQELFKGSSGASSKLDQLGDRKYLHPHECSLFSYFRYGFGLLNHISRAEANLRL